MGNQEQASITIGGELAAWLIQRANRNTRTPEQELAHILIPYRERQQKAKERREKREAWRTWNKAA